MNNSSIFRAEGSVSWFSLDEEELQNGGGFLWAPMVWFPPGTVQRLKAADVIQC